MEAAGQQANIALSELWCDLRDHPEIKHLLDNITPGQGAPPKPHRDPAVLLLPRAKKRPKGKRGGQQAAGKSDGRVPKKKAKASTEAAGSGEEGGRCPTLFAIMEEAQGR